VSEYPPRGASRAAFVFRRINSLAVSFLLAFLLDFAVSRPHR
jgi:hypothetical protein